MAEPLVEEPAKVVDLMAALEASLARRRARAVADEARPAAGEGGGEEDQEGRRQEGQTKATKTGVAAAKSA